MAIAPAPRTDVDIFSDEVLRDPYPTYAELRAMGPAVHLDRLGVWALPRYAQVRSALGDWKTFSSSAAVGLNDVVNGSVAGTVLATDPPEHETLRAVLTEQLGPRALRDIRTFIERSAEDLVDRLVQRGRFDAVSDLAVALPMSVVFDLIGLPEHVRGDMLRWAEGTFQVFGPMNERTQRSLPIIEEMYSWLATVRAEDLAPGSMGRAIFAAAEAGRIEHDSCVPLLSAYTTAGMDTTISALAHAIHLLGRYPQQWDALRAAPEAIPAH